MPLLTSEVLLGFSPSVTRAEGIARGPARANADLSSREQVDVPTMVTNLTFTDGQHSVVVAMDDLGVQELLELLSGVVLPS